MRPYQFVTCLVSLVLCTTLSSISMAAPKACSTDTTDKVMQIPITSADPVTAQALWMIGILVDVGNGTIAPSSAPIITAADGDQTFTLTCIDTGDGATMTHIYGCAFATADQGKLTASTFDLKYTITLAGVACLYTGPVDFADPMVLTPDQLKVTDVKVVFETQFKNCLDKLGAAGVLFGICPAIATVTSAVVKLVQVWHDAAYNIDDDDIPASKDPCPYANGSTSCTATDTDGDGTTNAEDNCEALPNQGQADADEDGIGDVCDVDRDGDGVNNTDDNCPNTANKDQADADADGNGNACDKDQTIACDPAKPNACAAASGTFCHIEFKQCLSATDADGDGTPDVLDQCPGHGTELDPCGVALPSKVTPPTKTDPATGDSADGGGGCALQLAVVPEHSTGVYLLLSFLAVLSALGMTKTNFTTKDQR